MQLVATLTKYHFINIKSGIPQEFVDESEWDSIFNFLTDGEPTKNTWLKGFVENIEDIAKIISSVRFVD